MTRTFTLLALLLTIPLAAIGDVYKWQDEDGNWHYSDKPPAEGKSFDTISVPVEPRNMVIARRAGPEHRPEHYFINQYAGPAEIELTITEASNVRPVPPLPARFVLPGQVERKLVAFEGIDPTLGFAYRLGFTLVPGEPMTTLPSDLDYFPPFARGTTFPISQGLDEDKTHQDAANEWAVDIAMPVGTPVLAARGGVVMDFEDDFRGEGKQDKKFLPRANHVRILHDDGSMGVYAHLQSNSARVRPGMRVPTGRWIANSGNTGYSSGPHLHFVVQINVGMELQALPFRFKLPGGGVMDPDRKQLLEGVLPRPAP